MTDEHIIHFLQEARQNLAPGGKIILKENVSDGKLELDDSDNSIMRTDPMLQELFLRGGFQVVHRQDQEGFPEDLYRISCYVLEKIA